ncbi:hypothetical protein NDN08_002212 [Rhodosorus marinus]|uniref:N-acetyltransferase domain-containing protein n=1 Tax=Rhodosorus marinus TaxID=101924 RepID=A0AAV8UXD8_9RHOD|nr:hypothetical protein NDN08_002212 [Rhodosorus marinus]
MDSYALCKCSSSALIPSFAPSLNFLRFGRQLRAVKSSVDSRRTALEYAVREITGDETSKFSSVCAEAFFDAAEESNSKISRRIRAEVALSRWFRVMFSKVLETYVVASREGDIHGVVELTLEKNLPGAGNAPLFGTTYFAYLQNLGVVTMARRKGLGTMLVKHCEEQAMNWGYDKIFLHVGVKNKHAVQFYESQGYVIVYKDPAWKRFLGLSPMFLLRKPLMST